MPALEFRIDLSGNLVDALRKGGGELEKTGEHAKHAKHEFELFEAETGKLSGSLGGLGLNLSALSRGGAFFTFDLAEGLKGAYEIVEGLVDKFVDLGKEMVGVAGKTQDLNLAIKLNAGDGGAKEVDELAESFQRTTRFSAAGIKQALLPLLRQGVTDKETLDSVATIATDLAARNAGGIQDVQQTISSFAGIFQRGRLKPAQLAQFGIQANDYFKELASSLGVSVGAAAKLAKAGKVSQDKLADIAINMVAKRQGGAIGGPTLDAAKTLGATLERLGNLKENLFERVADSPGMASVQRFLDTFIDVMGGPVGTELVQHLSDILEKVFGGPETDVNSIRDTLKDAVQLVTEMVDAGKALADALLPSLSTIQDLVIGMREYVALSSGDKAGFQAALVEEMTVRATRIARANRAIDETSARGEFGNRARNDFGSGIDPMTSMLDAFSGYNRVLTGSSTAIPKMARGGLVTGPTLALIGEGGPEAVVPLSDPALASTRPFGGAGGGRGNVTIDIGGINIDVSAPGGDGQAIGLAAAQVVRVELKKILDEAGWAYGATVLE